MAVVVSEDGKTVLLLRREIFILWDLPGGMIEKGEEAAQAAARECEEETGYRISIENLIGIYRHPSVYGRGDQITYAYRGHVTGGKAIKLGLETTGLRWCTPPHFPAGFQPLHRQIVEDALKGSPEPFERHILFPLWKLYPARVVFILLRLVTGAMRALGIKH